jgi:hypothetical protein
MRRIALPVVVFALLTGPVVFSPARTEGKEDLPGRPIPADVRDALEKAEQMELYSLDPDVDRKDEQGFHGWKVLGKVELTKADVKGRVVRAVIKGMEEPASPAKCFEPRHGIRLVGKGKTTDLVICFACSQTYVYRAGPDRVTLFTSKAPQTVLDKVLTDAKVPLPKPGKP